MVARHCHAVIRWYLHMQLSNGNATIVNFHFCSSLTRTLMSQAVWIYSRTELSTNSTDHRRDLSVPSTINGKRLEWGTDDIGEHLPDLDEIQPRGNPRGQCGMPTLRRSTPASMTGVGVKGGHIHLQLVLYWYG